MIRVELTDQHGTVTLVLDETPGRRHDRVAELADRAVRELAAVPGVASEEHARHILMAELTRQYADQLAYERVAEQRGLLPL